MRLLDSDVMIDLQRRYPPALAWLDSLTEAPGLPGPVVLELMRGCRNKQEMAIVQALVQPFAVYWPTAQDGDQAIALYSRLCLSHALGIPDLLIAVCALGAGATLCTFDRKHMGAIPGLVTEQPYSK